MNKYNIYNFLVYSDILLPCLPINDNAFKEEEVDIYIERTKIHNIIKSKNVVLDFRKKGDLRCYDIGDYMLIFLSESIKVKINKNGKHILVDSSEKDIEKAVALVIGLGLSLTLLFKGTIPLHSAAIEIDGKVIGIMAESGVGKSTLLWNYLLKGAKFITDDVLPISIENGKVLAIPTVSLPSKLWGSDLEKYDIEMNKSQKVFSDIDKYYVHIRKEMRIDKVIPLDMLVILNPYSHENVSIPERVVLERAENTSKIINLFENIHGNWTLPKEFLPRLLNLNSIVLKNVPIYSLKYNKKFSVIPLLMKKIQETVLYA